MRERGGFVHVTTETVAKPSGLSDQLIFASKTLHDKEH